MIKKYNHDTSNISNAVSMILKSAKKRRALAISAAKSINSETGLGNKLIVIKWYFNLSFEYSINSYMTTF